MKINIGSKKTCNQQNKKDRIWI